MDSNHSDRPRIITMSSPASRRTRQSRDSATASPARSTRSRQQQEQTTPRASRRLREESAIPASSPIFFQSSPSRGNDGAETPDVSMDEPGDATPRGNASNIRGMCLPHHLIGCSDKGSQIYQIPLRSITWPVRAQHALNPAACTPTPAVDFSSLQDPIVASHRAAMI